MFSVGGGWKLPAERIQTAAQNVIQSNRIYIFVLPTQKMRQCLLFWSLLLANSWPRLKVSHDSSCTGPVSKMQPPLPNPQICCHQTIYIAQSSVPGSENQCMTARHRRYWKHQFQRENRSQIWNETYLHQDFRDPDGNIAGTWEELHVMILLQWDVCLSARCDISDCRIFH